ncbi:tyrosine-protein kinase receptor TYRO3 isoform X2 [Anabas testudineus]|uniref:Tyrosine-protein kinase receptor TYRO3 n=1 Tax=Anabas testudineus TaxID=64144 RepID=A0A3Q1IID0_ANATE|nr:tyrosine-protein kinase receptor TYRO3 isoform X2 [Anabas testudineus]XP_026195018.1 tyrosine-protein kinase receptor TYRO3 isoform X2 [Anabas testudineus]
MLPPPPGVLFTKHPTNQTVSQGNTVRLGCAVQGLMEPDIVWLKDGEKLYSTDQMFITLGEQHWETFHSVKSVQQQDAGQYWCEVEFHDLTFSSQRAWITVEGVPHFIQEPQDVATFPNVPFNLTCAAVGPPEPVEVLWWLGGVQEGDPRLSPSVLQIQGVNSSVKFYCEAKNTRGISVSRTGTVHIKVLPSAPSELQVQRMVDNNVTLSWKPRSTGHSKLSRCIIQVSRQSTQKLDLPHQEVLVPPHIQVLSGLRSYSNYSVRVACVNEVGASPFSPWLQFQTPESVPSTPPRNLTFDLLEQHLSLNWAKLQDNELQGKLLAYKVQWTLGGEPQEPLLFKENSAQLSGAGRFFNASFQVSACTSVGCGPWSPPVLVLPSSVEVQVQRSHMWVGLMLGVLVATVVGLLLTVLARRRGKETRFGSVFKPPGPESSVSFTAARSFNRGGAEMKESTLDCLGISDDLKDKLQDVLIPERLITLGHMLGKGEFGSVREAYLKMEDSSVHKVAVKVLKSDVTSSGDIEQCLKEAAYMKDFHHPNVIQLIGVSLHRRPGQRLPIPMVVLPFMKHGDLHTFLLLSRLGEQPFDLSLQTLVQFMLDISRGMEYLSSRNIIHRDLAARNCMLNEDMSVCVADFGLSKKIYSGDYYRQGSVSKLPVKWIALESLADNVYTTQSDVWAFGVTMWEVMTRGQTPYPGVENSEIYEYLIKGERLKKPLDCRDDVYELMHSCWSPVPKCRPSFQHLVSQLEALWVSVSPTPLLKEPLLYVNLDGEEREVCRDGVGAAMAPGPEEQTVAAASSWSVPWQRRGEDEEQDWLMVGSGAALAIGGDYRYIIGPCGGLEEEGEEGEEVGGGAGRRHTLQEEMRDEDDDVIINV